VLLLDEIGLAEHSPDMPLKVLHAILVPTCPTVYVLLPAVPVCCALPCLPAACVPPMCPVPCAYPALARWLRVSPCRLLPVLPLQLL